MNGKRIDFGYRTRSLRLRGVSARVPVRLAVVTAVLAATAVVLALSGLAFGEYPLSITQVARALIAGEGFERTVVVEWRMPVAVAAVVFGAMLGIGGAIFQSVTRNPLGSPDVIGFDVGAYTAVVITILVLDGGSSWSLTAAALVGGLGTAIVVYALAYRRGIRGFRLIVVGIAVAAMLGSVNAYLVTRADIDGAMTVGFWAAGSLDRVTWAGVIPAALVAAAVVLVVFVAARDLRSLELGDDAACTQGTRVTRARLVLLVAGVASTALVTAAAGPIAFVALAAPQLAKRLTRSPGVSLIAAAAMGAALLAAAQLLALIIAQLYRPIPVGLLTVCIGGLYLVWLLIREARRRTTGS